MKTAKLDTMSLDALIERFVETGVDQDEAFFHDQIGVFNRLYKKKAAVVAELKARDGDQRRALIPLYTHPNMQVRINAVKATLVLEPDRGRKQLEDIYASQHPPQYLEAGMTLSNLDNGTFKPT